jgi:hypothetical protein
MSLKSLREAQFRFNKIKSAQLEIDYKQGEINHPALDYSFT